jgi:hypothetical protein
VYESSTLLCIGFFCRTLIERKQFYTKPFDAFFSKEKNTQNSIITAIKEQRKDDNYNYDAMLGKVTNFSWKFNSDGSYDISLNLILYTISFTQQVHPT